MSRERLKKLLRSAIYYIEDLEQCNNYFDLFEELGITEEEYNEIMETIEL